jgi:hypothetical protein
MYENEKAMLQDGLIIHPKAGQVSPNQMFSGEKEKIWMILITSLFCSPLQHDNKEGKLAYELTTKYGNEISWDSR